MTWSERLFLATLLFNVLIVLAYLVLMLFVKKESKRSTWIKAIVMLICPVAGPLCILFAYLMYLLFSRTNVDLEDVIFSKERVKTYSYPDADREMNLVSMEDAIAVVDNTSLRRLMLDVVKDDNGDSLKAISKALNSSDSETSHYAASVLQDKLGQFRREVQIAFRQLQQIEDEQERARAAVELLDIMEPMLDKGVFGASEQLAMVQMMDTTAEILFEADHNRMEGRHYDGVSRLALAVKEITIAEKWCNRLQDAYPDMLLAYTGRLRMYFEQGKREEFLLTLENLKKSDVVIDAKTLELIRTFE